MHAQPIIPQMITLMKKKIKEVRGKENYSLLHYAFVPIFFAGLKTSISVLAGISLFTQIGIGRSRIY